MPSQYEFQELDRSITALEKNTSKLIASFDDITTTITKAKFNEKEYGERAVSQRINKIVDYAKSKITSSYNNCINSVRRAAHDSLETIKKSANSASNYCSDLNDLLVSLNNLNQLFAEKNYRGVIASGIRVELYPSEIAGYVTLLKLESFDAICKSGINDRSLDHYHDCKRYFDACKQNNAPNHLTRSALLLFYAAYSLSEKSTEDSYGVYLDGLKSYVEMSDNHKESYKSKYQSLYLKTVSIFNALCEKAYYSFDYLKVKSLLDDSKCFSDKDISIEFFKDSQCSPEKLFSYVLNNFKFSPRDTMQMVLKDTIPISLASTSREYLAFWLNQYDEYGFDFIKQIIDYRGNRFATEQIIAELIPIGFAQRKNPGKMVFDLISDYQDYLESISEQIPLLLFAQTAVKWAKAIRNAGHINDAQEQAEFNRAVELIDGLSYSMIVKYQKFCNCFDSKMIDELNIVLDEASNRLFGKPYKKDLQKSDKGLDEVESIIVKLVSVQRNKKKKKKAILWFSMVILIAIIVAVVIILTKR